MNRTSWKAPCISNLITRDTHELLKKLLIFSVLQCLLGAETPPAGRVRDQPGDGVGEPCRTD